MGRLEHCWEMKNRIGWRVWRNDMRRAGSSAPLLTFCPSTFSAAYLSCGQTLLILLAVFAAFLLLTGVNARAQVPVEVVVEAVPIVVTSTTADYFVLYVKHDVDGTEVEIPVLVKRGEAGTTTLAENIEALAPERYRVEKYLVAQPADIDGDGIDDITELGDPVGMNPVNSAAALDFNDGVVAVPDRETFEALFVALPNGEFHGKFVLLGKNAARPGVYIQNSRTHQYHYNFLQATDIDENLDGMLVGQISYYPKLVAPDGSSGVYVFRYTGVTGLRDYYPFNIVAHTYTALAASMPLIEDNLAYHMSNRMLPLARDDLPLYEDSRINRVFDADILPKTGFLALNPGEGYGLLRVMDPDERPHPRDIVIYEALPNELPRVAGIVSTVPQTPLSHVNLRAVQDGVPNAYIRDALDNNAIADLLGSYVRYTVTETGWDIRAATRAEVDAHHAASRPAQAQTPQRDLSVTSITPLGEIGFEDWTAFGVKAANVAVLGTLRFPAGTVPDGFAIPFYFYDEFMKHNDFYTRVETMLANEDFQMDLEIQDDMLDDLRDAIKDAETPEWIIDALTAMHATYPEGQSLRYRSSTNNEDLPGFNGAGLYDSKTQHPEETEEDGIAKSLKQVFASLWNFRAFTERDFHRIDHLEAKMGVLVHPNYSDELANGVAVSFDTIYGNNEWYYVNTQVGEDLVTNPDALSVPEAIRLHRSGGSYQVLATSNQVPTGQLLMSNDQLAQLGRHLAVIHDHFEGLYNPAPGDPFAMEIEFKITSENILAIKQARPWVFGIATETVTPPPPTPPPPPDPPPPQPPGGGGGGGGAPRTSAPGAPSNLTAVGGDGQAVLNWDAPSSDGGAEITDYEYRINRSGPWISIGSTETTYTVTGLVNGTAYVFEVRAVNAAGRSASSNRAEATPEVFTLDFAHFANGALITSDLVFVNVGTHPIRPALYFYDQEGQLDCRRIGGGGHGRSGDPRGRQPEHPDGDGAAGRTHDFDPRPRRASERIGAGGRVRSHRRSPAL